MRLSCVTRADSSSDRLRLYCGRWIVKGGYAATHFRVSTVVGTEPDAAEDPS